MRAAFAMAILFAVALITGMSVSGSGIDRFGLIGSAALAPFAIRGLRRAEDAGA